VKFYFSNDNWLSIRFSGTEPVLRVVYEATSEEQGKELEKVVMEDPNLAL